MGAKLAAPATPPAASLRNGLDLALSKDLGLDLAAAKPSPAVAAALAAGAPTAGPTWTAPPVPGEAGAALAALASGDAAHAGQIRASLTQDQPGASPLDLAVLDAALAVAGGKADGPTLSRLVELAERGKARRGPGPRPPPCCSPLRERRSIRRRGPRSRASRSTARPRRPGPSCWTRRPRPSAPGETAIVALWIAAEAGVAGPGPGDRARIVRALRAAGLEADARNFALEGLLTLP
jgi:hypothetical protein